MAIPADPDAVQPPRLSSEPERPSMTFHSRGLVKAPTDQTISILHCPRRGADSLPCWVAMPARRAPDMPPIVAVHGLHRCASAQVDLLSREAARTGRVVIAPLFAKDTWPMYQQVVHRGRADLALIRVLEDLKIAGIWDGGPIDLSGYSAGAQFAHRFAMLYPHLVCRLHLIAAGWYTFPDGARYPYGLQKSRTRAEDWSAQLQSGLSGFLALPIRVHVGALDNIVDANTRSGPRIDAQQGRSRLERARTWTAAITAAAVERGIVPDITLNVIEGCGHDFTSCIRIGGLDHALCQAAE
jgi:pimeloyl-ACP methyl ester carboxylesterase